MTAAPNNLEIKGSLAEQRLAELLAEITQAGLEGSLRLVSEARKVMIYFREGTVVFAVSNLRQHRLVEVILAETEIAKDKLAPYLGISNDLEFAEALLANRIFLKIEIEKFFIRQIENILKTAFEWQSGEWFFSPLVKIKESIRYKIDLGNLLIEHGRSLSNEAVVHRFKSFKESYNVRPAMPVHINLSPREAFLLSRIEASPVTIAEIKNVSGLSEADTLQTLYVLWLGGFLIRQDWAAAFSDRKVSTILSARLTLKKEASVPKPQEIKTEAPTTIVKKEETVEQKPADERIPLHKYLQDNESSANHYETLNIPIKATVAEIKHAYFQFAKQFHPDLYYKSAVPELHLRIQNAFTKLANAYETLRNESSREVYDFRLRKELAGMDKQTQTSAEFESADLQKRANLAAENFEQGFGFLEQENYEAAAPFLARAVHLAQTNARYHAFYGKALSFDKNERHKAEAELQTAIKLNPENTVYRIILAEFFIHYNLLKRAEGELNRLLAIAPNHAEAMALLDSLQNK